MMTDEIRPHASGIDCVDVVRDMSFSVGYAVMCVWNANGREDLELAHLYMKDAIAHSGFFYIGSDQDWPELLLRVADAEPDKTREAFFRAIQANMPQMALMAIEALLRRAS